MGRCGGKCGGNCTCCKTLISSDCVVFNTCPTDNCKDKLLTEVVEDIRNDIVDIENQLENPISVQNIGNGVEIYSGVDSGVYQFKTIKTKSLIIEEGDDFVAVDKGPVGALLDKDISGIYRIELGVYTQYNFTLLGNTILQPPSLGSNESGTFKCHITGGYSLSFPSWIKRKTGSDNYIGSGGNEVIITVVRGGTFPIGYYEIKNII